MTKQKGGTKRSSQLVFRRRLMLVRLLLRGPSSRDNLIASVRAELGSDVFPADASSALKHDMDALKFEYNCLIGFQRRSGCYAMESLGDLALLDLPDEGMEALSFLESSFPAGSELPEHVNIRALLERVLLLLPSRHQERHSRQSGAVSFQLTGTVPGRIDARVVSLIKRAIEQRREVMFDYLSTFDDEAPRRHRVAPYAIFFRPEGHGYLDATLLEVQPRRGETIHASIDYRLNRIVSGSVKILPTVLPPYRLKPPTYMLRYHLLPVVARRQDIATYFSNTQITYHDDGGATVTATVTNLWQVRHILLRYGTACEVLEPEELRQMFRETTRGLTRLYETEP